MDGASIEWEGKESLAKKLRAFPEAALDGAGVGLYLEAEDVMTESKEFYVPVKDGILRDSGFVHVPDVRGGEVSVTLGFGGAASAYAVVQHERLDFKHPNGGSAKYLERPLLLKGIGMAGRVGERVQFAIRRVLA